MVIPIQRVGNDPRREWSAVNSSFAQSQPPKGPQSHSYGLSPYGSAIESDMRKIFADAYFTQDPRNEIQNFLHEVINKDVKSFPSSDGLMPVQGPEIFPLIGPGEYDRFLSADWSNYQIHDTECQQDVPLLDDELSGFGATAHQDFRLSLSGDFAQNMEPPTYTRASFDAFAQPQPGDLEPYSDQENDTWALPTLYSTATPPLTLVWKP